MMLWEYLMWAAPTIALGIVSNILTPFARRALRKYSDKTRTLSSKISASVVDAYRQATSKISTSFKEISLLAVAKRHITRFAVLVVQVVCVVAYYSFWMAVIFNVIGAIAGGAKTSGANSVGTLQGSTCDCPAPTMGVSSGRTMNPGWGTGVSPRDCPERYGVRPRYAAQSVTYATERTPVADCSPPQKGRKGKRVQQPCAVGNTPPVLYAGYSGSSGYSIVDEPQ